MFGKWLDEYQKLSQKTRFVSQLATFFIAIFAFLSCCGVLNALYYNPSLLNHNWKDFLISIIFHLIIGIFFAVRFVLLFFHSKKNSWLSQIIWFLCIFTILGFHIATRFIIYGSFYPPESSVSFGMDNYPYFFLYAQNSFEPLLIFYFILSPVRHIVTVIHALVKVRRSKI